MYNMKYKIISKYKYHIFQSNTKMLSKIKTYKTSDEVMNATVVQPCYRSNDINHSNQIVFADK